MTVAFRTPAWRFALIVALSVLLHGAVLWLPKVTLPQGEALRPPLAAELHPLHKLVAKPVAKRPPGTAAKPARASPPAPVDAPPAPAVETAPNPVADAGVPISMPAIEPVSSVAATEDVQAPAIAAAPEEPEAPPLPKHAQLSFAVYKGVDGFRIGEASHQLDINGDDYTLKSVTRTVGLAKLFKSYELIQISRGKAGAGGLQPHTYTEEKNTGDGKQNLSAAFDWPSQQLRFSRGGETALPSGAQDILSVFYQLSQLSVMKGAVPLAVGDSKRLEKYSLEIAAEEEITTPMGKIHALHLRKLHTPGERGFEIWLGLEYRLLPVKFTQTEPSGEVVGEIVISDIRIAE